MRIPLVSNHYYHIYNHANGKENLFINEGNYSFFLKRYIHFISPIADTFAYCLMPNHFHFVIQIKSVQELQELQGFDKYNEVAKYCSKQFSKLFSSYTQALNKQQSRRGSLFAQNFERKEVSNKTYFMNLIHYVHFNPVYHGFVDDLRDWPHSSFASYSSSKASFLKREEVIGWYKDKKAFFDFHKNQINSRLALEFEFC